jgi:hypothetical protein
MVEMAQCLLKSMSVPPQLWGEAVRTAVYILNRALTRALNGVTPYELWHGRKPKVQHLRVFGCVARVKKIGPGVNKLADRSSMMIFIGYEEGSKCYRVYDPIANKLQVSRDIVFEENRTWAWEENSTVVSKQPLFTITHMLQDGTLELDTGMGSASSSTSSSPLFQDSSTPMPRSSTPALPSSPVRTSTQATSSAAMPQCMPSTGGIRWATPLSNDDGRDADSGPIRYRWLSCVYGTAEEVDEECMLAVEEP